MKKILLSILLLLTALFLPSRVLAKDYSIKSADIDVQINGDGSANITESRIYSFDGSYSWADEWIFLKGHTISGIEVAGADKFTVSQETDKVYIKWYYTAENEEKTFTLNYVIKDALTNQKDTSEFYWQLIGGEWAKGTGEINAKVHLPYPVPNDQVWAFGHGPLNGKIYIVSNQEVDFSAANLPANKFFEVRVLFPTNSTFVNAQKGNLTLESILAEEKTFAAKTKTQSLILLAVAALIALLAIWRMTVWVIRWYKIGRDEPLPEVNLAGTLHAPPNDLAPAYVETMLHGNPTGKSIVATILELTRRKILAIDYVKDGKKSLFGNKDQYLLVLKKVDYKKVTSEMENDLIDFLFSDEPKIDFDDIKNFAKTKPSSTNSFWLKWKEDASEGLKELGYYEKESLEWQKRAILETVLIIIISWVGVFIFSPLLAPVAIIGSVARILTTIFMPKKSKWGGKEKASWLAFKKWLKDYSNRFQNGSLLP